MEILAIMIPLLTFIIPMFIMLIIYAAVLALVIWFIITFLNNQKERNRLLADISMQLKQQNKPESEESATGKAETVQAEATDQGKNDTLEAEE